MSRAIVKIKDKYFIWSSIVDAPITYGLTLDQLKVWHKEEYGRSVNIEERLERVEKYGTSIRIPTSVEKLIRLNRAGDNEEHLSLDEIYKKYSYPDVD